MQTIKRVRLTYNENVVSIRPSVCFVSETTSHTSKTLVVISLYLALTLHDDLDELCRYFKKFSS